MLVDEVLRCSFPSWYPTFEKVTISSELIPLPGPVLGYLLEDGQLVLPAECNDENRDGDEDDYEEFGEVDWTELGQDPELEQKTFVEFSAKVTETLQRFGGKMFCKLNWSSPRDAMWIGFNNSLKVCSLAQLYLLLKSSDFVAHDLTLPFKFCEDKDEERPGVEYSLVLRRWVDVNPGTEFRCFVREGEVRAICQRDNTNYYDHIVNQQESIKQDILTFYREHIRDKFPLHSYVFDVIRARKDSVLLVDFNPFGETTDPLFFSWDELREGSEQLEQGSEQLEFRFATDSSGVQPHPYRHYSIPRDFVDLGSGSDPHKLIDFLNLKQRTENKQTGTESDSD